MKLATALTALCAAATPAYSCQSVSLQEAAAQVAAQINRECGCDKGTTPMGYPPQFAVMMLRGEARKSTTSEMAYRLGVMDDVEKGEACTFTDKR